MQLLRDHHGNPTGRDLPGLLVQRPVRTLGQAGQGGAGGRAARQERCKPCEGTSRTRQMPGRSAWPGTGFVGRTRPRRDLRSTACSPALLKSAPVCDVALERFLTNVQLRPARRSQRPRFPLSRASGRVLSISAVRWRSSASSTNTSMPAPMRNPIERADLRSSLSPATLPAGAAVPALRLAVAGVLRHRSIRCHEAGALLDRTWSEGVTDLLQQQVREPAGDFRVFRRSIPALTGDRGCRVRGGAAAIRGKSIPPLGEVPAAAIKPLDCRPIPARAIRDWHPSATLARRTSTS